MSGIVESIKHAGEKVAEKLGGQSKAIALKAEIKAHEAQIQEFKKEFGVKSWQAAKDRDSDGVQKAFASVHEKIAELEQKISKAQAEVSTIGKEESAKKAKET